MTAVGSIVTPSSIRALGEMVRGGVSLVLAQSWIVTIWIEQFESGGERSIRIFRDQGHGGGRHLCAVTW